jgi:hypothetical protein
MELIFACDLCAASHLLEACPHCYIIAGHRLANGLIIPQPGQRKCGVHWASEHQKRTCHCRRELEALAQTKKDEEEEDSELS